MKTQTARSIENMKASVKVFTDIIAKIENDTYATMVEPKDREQVMEAVTRTLDSILAETAARVHNDI